MLPMAGGHNLMNAMCALSVCIQDGIPFEDAVAALKTLPGVSGRLERFHHEGVDVIIDYAHTPDALQQVLDILKTQSSSRLISVFGCGGDRDQAKRAVMGRVSSERSDLTILTNDNPRSEEPNAILRDIQLGMVDGHANELIPDRYDAICHAIDIAESGDVVLIAGKGHETTQEMGENDYSLQ